METNYREHKCAHTPCRCLVEEPGGFCSDWCEQAGTTTDCGCGHEECGAFA